MCIHPFPNGCLINVLRRIHLWSERQMVISSNLSLIPYPKDNYTLQPLNRQMMLPDRELGHQAMNRHGLSRRPTVRYHCIPADHQNLTYNQYLIRDSSQIDQLGSRVDIYIWCFTSWTSTYSGNLQSEMSQLNSQKFIKKKMAPFSKSVTVFPKDSSVAPCWLHFFSGILI